MDVKIRDLFDGSVLAETLDAGPVTITTPAGRFTINQPCGNFAVYRHCADGSSCEVFRYGDDEVKTTLSVDKETFDAIEEHAKDAKFYEVDFRAGEVLAGLIRDGITYRAAVQDKDPLQVIQVMVRSSTASAIRQHAIDARDAGIGCSDSEAADNLILQGLNARDAAKRQASDSPAPSTEDQDGR